MISLKVKEKSAHIFILLLLLFIGLFRICIFSNTVFRAYSLVILGILFVYTCFNMKRLKRNIPALCLGAIVALSVLYQNHSMTGLFNAAVYFLEFTTPFLLLDYLFLRYGVKETVKGLMYVSVFICSLMDFSVLIGMDLDKSHYQNLITYLFGNKFMVAYLHMQTVAFIGLYLNYKKKKKNNSLGIGLFIYGVFGIAMCAYVNCATGIIGNSVILLLLYFPMSKGVKNTLAKPMTMMIILLVVNVLLLGFDIVGQVSFLQNFIVNVLNKDVTLTGRYTIYAMLPDLIKDHLLLGYGYNSDIFADLIGYGNTQNGILQYVIDCGIPGTAALIITWYTSVKKMHTSSVNSWALVCAVYGFIICSTVEVCFKFNFILILAVIRAVATAVKE